MATKQRDAAPVGTEAAERSRLDAAIGARVIDALGRPRDFLRVQVRRLWEGHYRVNVLTGDNAATATIAHSFFVSADAAGTLGVSVPPITRRYEDRPDNGQ